MGTIDYKIFKKNLKNDLKPSLNFIMAKLIRDARISRGVTQKKLAEDLKTKQESISRWESGESIPRLQNLQKIAKILNIEFSPEKIFTHEQNTGDTLLFLGHDDISFGHVISKQSSKDKVIQYK